MPLINLVTCAHLPEPDPDMAPLEAALTAAGLDWRWLAWTAPDVDWSQGVSVIRSPWDYYLRRPRFLAWAAHVEHVGRLLNPREIVEWTTHKRYLAELERAGVPVVPTLFVPPDDTTELSALAASRGWSKVVTKPAIGAASDRTRVIDLRAEHDPARALFEVERTSREMLIQPFLPRFTDPGERSVVVIDGVISHVVQKYPRLAGEDERVIPGGSVTPAERVIVEAALGAIPGASDGPLLYARVDLVELEPGQPCISELELAEPSLYFSLGPGSATRFAEALAGRIHSRPLAGPRD